MEHSHKPNKLTERIDQLTRSTKALQEALEPKNMTCPDHGEYTSTGARYIGSREIWSRCPDCHERMVADERQAEAEKQAKIVREKLEYQLEQSAIPARFISKTFDSFKAQSDQQQKALEIVRGYADGFETHYRQGDGLVLSGLPGTGKSHLAAAVLQAIMPKHCGLYMTCMGLIRSVRNTWRKDSEASEMEVLRTFGTVPLLVLDEIGVQYGTDGEQTIIFDVLDRRYREMMPTILLTNQAKQGFKEFIGERSFDRLTETSRWVSFDWESFRPQARREAA